MSVLNITRDSGANVKILKILENKGYIKIYDVMLENGRKNKKVKEKILPVAVWNHSCWDEAVWTGDDCVYDDIRKILGAEHVKDAMHLEAHVRSGHDYFVTEDTDFLNKRKELDSRFCVKIVTPEELQAICESGC